MSATRYKRPHVDIFICIEMARERNRIIKKNHPVYGGGQIRLQEKVKLCTRINSLNSEQRQIDI